MKKNTSKSILKPIFLLYGIFSTFLLFLFLGANGENIPKSYTPWHRIIHTFKGAGIYTIFFITSFALFFLCFISTSKDRKDFILTY